MGRTKQQCEYKLYTTFGSIWPEIISLCIDPPSLPSPLEKSERGIFLIFPEGRGGLYMGHK